MFCWERAVGLSTRKWGIAAEEDIGDEGCAEREQWACVLSVYACESDHTCEPVSYGRRFWWLREWRSRKRGELPVGRIREFCSVKRWIKGGQGWEIDLHAKFDDDDVTNGVRWRGRWRSWVCQVGEGREMRERKANVREVSMDDAMVEVVDGIKDWADDGDGVVQNSNSS